MIRTLLLAIVSSLLLAGCSEPKIDTTTKESAERSIQDVRESLPPEKRDEFQTIVGQAAVAGFMQSALTGVQPSPEALFAAFHGMTGEEAIAHAKKVKADQEAKMAEARAASRREELAELEAQVSKREAQLEAAKMIRVTSFRVNEIERRYLGSDYAIAADIFNGTREPLKSVSVQVRLKDPGRSVPWYEGQYALSPPGGIEPGETASYQGVFFEAITLHRRIREHGSAQIFVTVVDAERPDGTRLVTTPELADFEKQRLAELRDEVN
jgi:hypothetical protein